MSEHILYSNRINEVRRTETSAFLGRMHSFVMKWGSQHYSKYLGVWMPGAHLHLLWGHFSHFPFRVTLFPALLYRLLSCYYCQGPRLESPLCFISSLWKFISIIDWKFLGGRGHTGLDPAVSPILMGCLGGAVGPCMYQRCKITGMQRSRRNRWWVAKGSLPSMSSPPPHLLMGV